MTLKYTAPSLIDIADSFDAKAKAIMDRRAMVLNKREVDALLAEAETWKQAAFILRNTTLTNDSKGQS